MERSKLTGGSTTARLYGMPVASARQILTAGTLFLAAACFYFMLLFVGYGLVARDGAVLGLGLLLLALGVALAWAGRRIAGA